MRDDRDLGVLRPAPEGMRLRPLTLTLLALLLLLVGGALLPASWVLAAPGDGYGPGTCGVDTTRTCEATDSVLGAAATALAAAIGTPDSAVPTKVMMAGSKAIAVGGVMGTVTAGDAASPKVSLQGIALTHLTKADGSASLGEAGASPLYTSAAVSSLPAVTGTVAVSSVPLSQGAGNSDATTLRAVLASDGIGSATLPAVTKITSWAGAACTTVDVAAANTVVLASSSTRQYVQVCNNDPTLDDVALVNVGAASAGGARLNKPLVAGDRGDCQPFPPGAARVGQSAGAAATVTLSVCAW